LFQLKNLLEERLDELARTITNECGKTYQESVGELRRGIENVEVACGAPILIQGSNNEDIASGIDEHMIRQPVGVVAAITPFNFPAMIPLWFLPYALATGNAFILKPSEKTPLTGRLLFEIIDSLGLPPGVAQLVNGGKDAVDALLEHPLIRAISFVGTTDVARYVYGRAGALGKRAQCQGGARNPVVILPDADIEMAARVVADSAYGCAGQRCLASPQAIAVGEAADPFVEAVGSIANSRRVGYGLDEGTEMGPLIRPESVARVGGLVQQAVDQGARPVAEGGKRRVDGYEEGYFFFPTLLDHVPADVDLAKSEVFGPVLSVSRVRTLEEALSVVNDRPQGNMACIFTTSGAAARQFRHQANAGNIGINVGVAAPMAFFPFSGWEESFFGDLHAQGRHAVEFYTQTKVVVERWMDEWARTF
jgi:malonate-semialdehyde dehydrogenase (acetylating)/methylmalonate-semialdehyde dehydrogenase